MANVIELAEHMPSVHYTVRMTQHWNGGFEVQVEDVQDDDRSRLSVADALQRAADLLRNSVGKMRD